MCNSYLNIFKNGNDCDNKLISPSFEEYPILNFNSPCKIKDSGINKIKFKQKVKMKLKSIDITSFNMVDNKIADDKKTIIHDKNSLNLKGNLKGIFELVYTDRMKKKKFKKCSYAELDSAFLNEIKKQTCWQATNSGSHITTNIDHELSLISHFVKNDHDGKMMMMNHILMDQYNIQKIEDFIPKICDAAKKCLVVQNAGADLARKSEAVSIHYFKERFHAKDFVLETDILYVFTYKMVDFVCTIYNRRVGCSVTRAMHWENPDLFTIEMAKILLEKKLYGLILARGNVGELHAFNTCFLHILCQTQQIADLLNQVYPEVIKNDESNTYQDIIILATVFKESFIYSNDRHDLDHIKF